MIVIDEQRCVGCGTCVADCVSGTIQVHEGKAHIKGPCFQCGHCVALCPHEAISVSNYSDPSIAYDEETCSLATTNVLNALKFRRSIRHFQKRTISYDDLHILMDAAAHTPTAKNAQACRFVFIQDSLSLVKDMVWNWLRVAYDTNQDMPIPWETIKQFFALRDADQPQDFLFRNAPAVLCIQAPDPVDAGLAASAIELVGTTLGIGVLYNGYLRRAIGAMPELQAYLDMDLEEKPLVVCMLIGYSNVTYLRSAPRRNPSVVLR